MASPLVETKLYMPRLRRDLVSRPRLRDRLSRGSQSRLTVVSAPAGFGKTTVLIDWLMAAPAEDQAVAWLSLDEGDSDPALFWTYLITALQTMAPGVGASALPLLQSARPPIETVLTTVLNELRTLPYELYVVLDDYHLADGPGIQSGMAFLLDHLPPQVHVAISTRSDPALPLARLRARGDLVELRSLDLRFTPDEVAAYVSEAGGFELSESDVETLEMRTEGWIAAVQLAALSMQGRDDVSGFIAGFAGDDRYVVDYLVEEVLSRQPDRTRTFLLRTSILDRLSGPLCDAVTEESDGKSTLESLDRTNLFVIPLDDSRRWYRYHHLFADVLQTHLLDERRDEVSALHRRASDWYDQAGEPLPAVRHALSSGDVERAADLVELAIPAMRRDRQEATIRGWIDDLPGDVVRRRPVLATGFVGALMAGNEFDGVEERLQDVERMLAASADGIVVADPDELPRVAGAIPLYRAALALATGDPAETVRLADLADRRAPADDHLTKAAASALAGLARWAVGDLDAAHRGYSAAVDGLRRAGHISDVLGCSITLADLRITQGRLGDAQRTYEDALRLASDEPDTVRGTADMHVGLSQLACERGDLAAAAEHLQRVRDLGEQNGLPQNPYRSRVAMARVREAEGDLTGALDLLDEAQRVYLGDFSPNVRPIPALRARLLVARGALGEAVDWARQQGLSADDELSYLRECEHITLARILLAQHQAEPSAARSATRLLDRLATAAESGGRTGSLLEILVLQALARRACDDIPGALTILERALALAEPEGYVRVFVGEGEPMRSLLAGVARRHDDWAYVQRLLAVDAPPEQPSPASQDLVEPLSDRELEVLRLLASDLDGPDIARELVVSLNTLRTHTKHIYAKLGVNSRRAAVRQAHELNLLTHR
jgi:ATP/maltotriose-dependent transcriptional regulator MalT